MNMDEKVSMDLSSPTSPSPPEHLCYVRCNFCNIVLAVVIPCKRMLETVTVKCGHCGNISFLTTRQPLQTQFLDHSLTPQGFNFMDKAGEGCNNEDRHSKKGQPPLSPPSSTATATDPDSPRPFVVKPPEKKHRLPSAYNRFMKEEIQRIKAANPEIPHREAFSNAAKNWARSLPEVPRGSLAGSSSTN